MPRNRDIRLIQNYEIKTVIHQKDNINHTSAINNSNIKTYKSKIEQQ